MPNFWIEHVKEYSRIHNLHYGCALSMPECKASYKPKKMTKAKAEPKEPKAKEPEPEPEPEPKFEVVKRRSRQTIQVPIYFIKSNLKKGQYNKALKQADKGSEEAMKYIASFPDKSRHYYKELIYGIINDFDEIHRIEDELKEPELSPSMLASRQARLKETQKAVKDKLETIEYKGFVPHFL